MQSEIHIRMMHLASAKNILNSHRSKGISFVILLLGNSFL
jgi:hypothetical protein